MTSFKIFFSNKLLDATKYEDNFLNYELKVAFEHKKKILPIIIDPETNIPSELKNLKYADFAKEYEDSMRQLTKALVTTLWEKKSGT